MGVVSQIYIHPLKGGVPMVVSEVQCNYRGPSCGAVKDRGFMVATPGYDAVDLRGKHPRVVLVELRQVEGGRWRLSGKKIYTIIMSHSTYLQPLEWSLVCSKSLMRVLKRTATACWISGLQGWTVGKRQLSGSQPSLEQNSG